jgi:hypothetical protein
MNLNNTLSVVGTILGFFGLGWFWAWLFDLVLKRHPARRVTRLGRRTPLDIIAPANITVPGDRREAATHMTSVGDVRAIAIASRFLSTNYRRKATKIYVGAGPGEPDGDRLLIGGDLRNQATVSFLEAFNEFYHAEVMVDSLSRVVALAGQRVEDFDQHWVPSEMHKGDLPTRDLAVIILAPWAPGDARRVLLCAGLTTYGTEGAASFLFSGLWTNKECKGLRAALKRAEAAAIVVQVWVENGAATRTRVLDHVIWDVNLAVKARGAGLGG